MILYLASSLPDPAAAVDQIQLMKYAVGWTCVGVFIITALAVCLAIFFPKVIPDATLRKRLCYGLVVEVVSICILLFSDIVKVNPSKDIDHLKKVATTATTAVVTANSQLGVAVDTINSQDNQLSAIPQPEDSGLVPR